MTTSKRIAGLLGPALVAVTVSESELINPHLYDRQIPPVVYLSGVLLFVAGLSIVRVHNLWAARWSVLVTLMGWLAILVGLFRMFAPALYQRGAQNAIVVLALEFILLVIGIFLTFKAYGRDDT